MADRKLWIDTTGKPVITTMPNGERNASRWGWTPAKAVTADAHTAEIAAAEKRGALRALRSMVDELLELRADVGVTYGLGITYAANYISDQIHAEGDHHAE